MCRDESCKRKGSQTADVEISEQTNPVSPVSPVSPVQSSQVRSKPRLEPTCGKRHQPRMKSRDERDKQTGWLMVDRIDVSREGADGTSARAART
jgi:hypothetical protein